MSVTIATIQKEILRRIQEAELTCQNQDFTSRVQTDAALILKDRIETLQNLLAFVNGLEKDFHEAQNGDQKLKLECRNLTKTIISRLSDGWGETEEALLALQIEPTVLKALEMQAGTSKETDITEISSASQKLAQEIILELSQGWGWHEECRAVEEITPLIHETMIRI